EWMNWRWDPKAEAVHKITLDSLLAEGRPREDVAKEVRAALSGRNPASDAPFFDRDWLETLLDDAVDDMVDLRLVLADLAGPGQPGADLLERAKNYASLSAP